jgi:integral membrane protein
MNNQLINQFRKIAFWEGVSFIVLMFIAMPLKYGANWPYAVKYVGWAHGLLFVLYGIWLIRVAIEYNWKLKRQALAMIAALLPFGTFIMEKKTKYYAENPD